VFPSTARAGTITITNIDFTGGRVGYTFDDERSPPNGGQGVLLGSVTMTAGADVSPELDGQTFEAYCVDILGPVFFGDPAGTEHQALVSNMSQWDDPNNALGPAADPTLSDRGRRAAWLYNEIAPSISPTDLSAPALRDRTALQMAIWNALYDEDFNVSNSTARFSVAADSPDGPDVIERTDVYLGLLQAQLLADASVVATSDAPWIQITFGTNGAAQDFMGRPTDSSPVPEPSAGLLLGMGVMSLAAFRSRKTLFRRA
jgi:hypothetical protein